MGGKEKKCSNVHQVVGKAEVKSIKVFRVGEREKRFVRFPFISLGKGLVIRHFFFYKLYSSGTNSLLSQKKFTQIIQDLF